MKEIYFRRYGKQIIGSDGTSGYDEGDKIIIEGKTFYREGNNRYNCPDNGRIYIVDGGSIYTLEDGTVGRYDNFGATIYQESESPRSNSLSINNFSNPNVGEGIGAILYLFFGYAKNHIIGILSFFLFFSPAFIIMENIIADAYIGFFMGLVSSIIISAIIEKGTKTICKSTKEYVHRKGIKGSVFLIVSIITILCVFGIIYGIYEDSNYINEKKQYIMEHPEGTHFSEHLVIKSKQNTINELKIMGFLFGATSIISGSIFIVKNVSKD